MIRILLAVAIAATGHAGAAVLMAVITVTGWLARTLLPVLPVVLAVCLPAAIAAVAALTVRELRGRPLFRPAVTR